MFIINLAISIISLPIKLMSANWFLTAAAFMAYMGWSMVQPVLAVL